MTPGATNMTGTESAAGATDTAATSGATCTAATSGASAPGGPITATTHVDMMAEAREAQWSAAAFLGPEAIRLVAPAKVNLFLGVGKPRDNGYHDVTTVMHALALRDILYMNCTPADEAAGEAQQTAPTPDGAAAASQTAPAPGSSNAEWAGPARSIVVRIDVADKSGAGATAAVGADDTTADRTHMTDQAHTTDRTHTAVGIKKAPIPVADNLAFKAIDALAHEIGYVKPVAIDIRIEKNIPLQAGLGGGSADAAAALIGAAHFWGVDPSGPTLERVASSLGADVAFFLKGGCGLFTGIGERCERMLDPRKDAVLLVKPAAGAPTKAVYEAFDQHPCPVPAEMIARASDALVARDVPLFNNLTSASESCLPELGGIIQWLKAQIGDDASDERVLLSGSGSAVFAICASADEAVRLAAEAGKRGLWARATSFSPLRAVMIG